MKQTYVNLKANRKWIQTPSEPERQILIIIF